MANVSVKIDDCWNKIGVWGHIRPRCPELERVIHCANCRTYSAAARQLLGRGMSAEYMQGYAEVIAQDKPDIRRRDLVSVVIFRIGDEWFGLRTHLFQEVIECRSVHSVPHRRGKVLLGLVNIRGELQLCVSIGHLLGIRKGEVQEPGAAKGIYERMVVVAKEGVRYVFPVSDVRGIRRYSPGDLLAPPATVTHGARAYLSGMILLKDGDAEHHVACLDGDLLFSGLERGIA